jgi:hypothetical protein
MPGQSVGDLRSINQISLLSVNLKFNGRQPRPSRLTCGERAEMQAGRKSTSRTIEVFDVLPPEPATRRRSTAAAHPIVIEDAVFEVVGPAGPRREHNDNPARAAAGKRVDLARLAAVAGVYLINWLERLLSGLSTQSFATLTASVFFIGFWLCGGFAAVATGPVQAPASPFAIENVLTEEMDENGMQLLAVGGMLVNRSNTAMATPSLAVVEEGGELIGSVTLAASEIAAGQSVRFFSRFKRAGGKSGAVTIFPVVK